MPNPPNTKTNPKTPDQAADIAQKNRGIIAGLAIRYYRSIPASAKASYDLEDMISDAVLHVYKRAVEGKYDPAIAKQTTWVHRVAERYLQNILAHHGAALRCAPTVSLEDVEIFVGSLDRPRDYVGVVEKVIEVCSEDVADLIEIIFRGFESGWPGDTLHAYLKRDRAVLVEFVSVARECGATVDDFVMAYRHAVA